jgi:hypothetical protein
MFAMPSQQWGLITILSILAVLYVLAMAYQVSCLFLGSAYGRVGQSGDKEAHSKQQVV